MSDAIEQLRARLAELADLENTAHLLQWDQQTMMPPRGASGRAEARATLERISHDMFVSAETGRLLEAAAAALDGSPNSDEASLVRVTRRRWEKARRVPSELAADLARAAAVGQEAWVQARANSDFAAFAPYLERNIELARLYVECFDDFECAYDTLLDDYEPGMRSAEVGALFAELKGELVPLIAKLCESSDRVDDRCLHGSFPIDRQRQLVAEVVERMGFDPSAWRIDDAVHPFAVGLGASDVRITTRWDETYFATGLYGAMHECGHGLYEAGIAPALARTPLEVQDLPEAWNSRFEQYLGLKVPDDAQGVLQDVHWSAGLIGYFPTYAIGNLIAGQLWERAHAEMPDLDERIAAGELGALRGWLRKHVHRHGAKFSASELLQREVEAPILVRPFTGYLKRKLSDVYGLDL